MYYSTQWALLLSFREKCVITKKCVRSESNVHPDLCEGRTRSLDCYIHKRPIVDNITRTV